MTTKTICLSVDVEEDLPGVVPLGTRGVEVGLPNLLRLLEAVHLQADFFFLASIVRRNPDFVRHVASLGHGIGNHGLDHQFLCAKSLSDQHQEVLKSTLILERIVAQEPRMFRAAGFSVNPATLEILQREGYVIDSSILPGRISRRLRLFPIYDHRRAPREPHFPIAGNGVNRTRLLEVPVTENPLRPGAPLGLGALNTFGTDTVLEAIRAAEEPMVVFLIHPWELVDLNAIYPRLPPGYARACSPDLTNLRGFLQKARDFATFATLASVRQGYVGA